MAVFNLLILMRISIIIPLHIAKRHENGVLGTIFKYGVKKTYTLLYTTQTV